MQKVILYSLKQVLHLQTGGIRESTTLSRCDFTLFNSIYNEIIFNIKNNDNINITSFPTLILYIIKDDVILSKHTLIKEKHYYVLRDNSISLPLGFYNYAVTTNTNSPIYTDQNFNMRGFFQVKPGLQQSNWNSVSYNLEYSIDNQEPVLASVISKYISTPSGDSVISTIAPIAGTLQISFTLEQNAPTSSEGWVVMYELFCPKDSRVSIPIVGKFSMVKFKFIPLNETELKNTDILTVDVF